MKSNYHTHNERCKHAFGSVADYARYAYDAGFNLIGMSDHAPFEGDMFGYRMDFYELPLYVEDVKEVKNQYKGKMDILLGLEIEYLPWMQRYYEELMERYFMDYLILGQHFFGIEDENVKYVHGMTSTTDYIQYALSVKEAMSKGYFKFVAHPDYIFVNDLPWDNNCVKACDIIVDSAVKYNTGLEFNGNGIRRGISKFCDGDRYQYPHKEFFKMVAESKALVYLNADCHKPEELDDEAMELSRKIACEWNLNLVN